MVDFTLPPVYSSPEGWGPPPDGEGDGLGSDCFHFAYEHLDKYPLSRVNRICDFTVAGQKYQEQRLAKGKGKGKKGQPGLMTPKDDEGFALVDTRPTKPTFSKGKSFGKGKKGKGLQANYQEGILGQKQKIIFPVMQKGKGKGRGGQQRRGVPSFKEWSVQTKTEWAVKREIQLVELGKLQVDAKQVTNTDVMWCGELRQYNKEFDRLTVAKEKPMKRFEELNFFNVTTSDDPVLTDIIQSDPEVTVIATDHVLAAIVAAGRSIYSWDLVITKINGKIIIDKRDGSQVDYLSVNESAQEPPNIEDKETLNTPMSLSQEASCLNQNFSQMVLDYSIEPDKMDQPNPFEEEDEEGTAACGAYRYRKITIPGDSKASAEFDQSPISMVVRTEINCKLSGEEERYCSVKALNEYDPKVTYSWRKHIEAQRGMILATELKNNAFKLGRWTAQAILAGCDVMKIGYASRNDPKNAWTHSVVSVQTYITDKFAEQIGMHRNNVYGILRSIVNMVMSWEDGKYLLIKDPIKPVMRIFEVPWETFGEEEDGDDEEVEEDEGDDLDEDGNVRPVQPSM